MLVRNKNMCVAFLMHSVICRWLIFVKLDLRIIFSHKAIWSADPYSRAGQALVEILNEGSKGENEIENALQMQMIFFFHHLWRKSSFYYSKSMVSVFKRGGIWTILYFTAFQCGCIQTHCKQIQSHDMGRVGACSNIAADAFDIYSMIL